MPIRCEHGVNDWTSAIGNVRVQFQKLKELGYDAVLNEHPAAGHGIRTLPPKTMEWLFSLKRDSNPKHVVHTCEHSRDGRAYWLKTDWEFIRFEGQEKRIPERFSERVHLALAHLRVMLRTADVGFAFWWGPEDKGLFGGHDFN